ncbi:MAG TPA: ribonuclease III [Bryobacteraceae bacterium]|nr:ribonuclease III [Bryobacteraceae bacterium]
MNADPRQLELAFGYAFRDPCLLVRALTHKSLASERRNAGEPLHDNERLEFLGDSILGYIVSEHLIKRFPDHAEGRLSIVRAQLVSAAHLCECAQRLQLGEYLQLGRGEEKGGGRGKNRLLANAMEALIAALYLDGGIEAARAFIETRIIGDAAAANVDPEQVNYKGPLQERAQQLGLAAPRYTVLSTTGPEHARTFVVEARIGASLVSRGEGSSKKAAGQNAARSMLEQLDQQTG